MWYLSLLVFLENIYVESLNNMSVIIVIKSYKFYDIAVVSVKESDCKIQFLVYEQNWCQKHDEKF